MLQKVFNGDNVFFRTMSLIADLMVLNLIYIICCVPIVTIGAATCALYKTLYDFTDNGGAGAAKNYFGYIKQFFRPATGFWLFLMMFAGVLYAEMWGIKLMSGAGRTIYFYLFILMVLLYMGVWSFGLSSMAWFESDLKTTLKNAFLIMLGSLPWLLVLGCITVIPILLILVPVVKVSAFIPVGMVLFGFAVLAYLKSLVYKKVYRKYKGGNL